MISLQGMADFLANIFLPLNSWQNFKLFSTQKSKICQEMTVLKGKGNLPKRAQRLTSEPG